MNRAHSLIARSRRAPFLVAVLLAGKAWGAEGGIPGPGHLGFDPASDTEDNSCVNPAFGSNLNDLYGMTEQVIGPAFCAVPPFSGHFVVGSGEFSIPVLRWVANADAGTAAFPLVYPPGYQPAGTPVDDAFSKFVSVRLLIDGEREYVFPAEDVVMVIEGVPGIPPGFLQVTFLPRLPPQSVGMHRLDYFWEVSERLCAGYSPLACIPAGETPFSTGGFDFEVVAGHQR